MHVPTIGYGFTWSSAVFRDWWLKMYGRKMRKGDTISEADALAVLKAMIEVEYAPPVDVAFAGRPPQIREPGYSMVFNAGTGALKWKWAQAIVSGDLGTAFRLWRTTATTANGRSLPGLIRRRNEEADIAELGKWPGWVGNTATSAPATYVADVDIRQAQVWLEQLGYSLGAADGVPGPRTVEATKRFQTDHGTLKVDGVIGRATLAALQRTIDLRRKAGGTVAAGAAPAAAGGADKVSDGALTNTVDTVAPGTDAGWVGDLLLWGGLAVIVVSLAYLAWRYRDELLSAVRKL